QRLARQAALSLSGSGWGVKLFSVVKRTNFIGQSCRSVANELRLVCFLARSLLAGATLSFAAVPQAYSSLPTPVRAVVDQYCVRCHDADLKKGDLDLEGLSHGDVSQHSAEWERVIRKLRARQMPPIGKERPPDKTYDAVVATLASSLDRAAAKNPN